MRVTRKKGEGTVYHYKAKKGESDIESLTRALKESVKDYKYSSKDLEYLFWSYEKHRKILYSALQKASDQNDFLTMNDKMVREIVGKFSEFIGIPQSLEEFLKDNNGEFEITLVKRWSDSFYVNKVTIKTATYLNYNNELTHRIRSKVTSYNIYDNAKKNPKRVEFDNEAPITDQGYKTILEYIERMISHYDR